MTLIVQTNVLKIILLQFIVLFFYLGTSLFNLVSIATSESHYVFFFPQAKDMVSSTKFTTTRTFTAVVIPTSEPASFLAIGVHLEGHNFFVWKAKIIPYLRASGLLSILDGSYPYLEKQVTITNENDFLIHVSNPAYTDWHVQDQTALG